MLPGGTFMGENPEFMKNSLIQQDSHAIQFSNSQYIIHESQQLKTTPLTWNPCTNPNLMRVSNPKTLPSFVYPPTMASIPTLSLQPVPTHENSTTQWFILNFRPFLCLISPSLNLNALLITQLLHQNEN